MVTVSETVQFVAIALVLEYFCIQLVFDRVCFGVLLYKCSFIIHSKYIWYLHSYRHPLTS